MCRELIEKIKEVGKQIIAAAQPNGECRRAKLLISDARCHVYALQCLRTLAMLFKVHTCVRMYILYNSIAPSWRDS